MKQSNPHMLLNPLMLYCHNFEIQYAWRCSRATIEGQYVSSGEPVLYSFAPSVCFVMYETFLTISQSPVTLLLRDAGMSS